MHILRNYFRQNHWINLDGMYVNTELKGKIVAHIIITTWPMANMFTYVSNLKWLIITGLDKLNNMSIYASRWESVYIYISSTIFKSSSKNHLNTLVNLFHCANSKPARYIILMTVCNKSTSWGSNSWMVQIIIMPHMIRIKECTKYDNTIACLMSESGASLYILYVLYTEHQHTFSSMVKPL